MASRRRWSRAAGRTLLVALAGTAPFLAVAAAAPPAGADPIASCSTTAGVVVAVDFGHWGGPVERGCDASTTTAYDALHRAGFTTAGDDADGPAFVCRIDDRPTAAEDACQTTPPADAYWEFWYADAGATAWTYAPTGAMTFAPAPGSVEAWVFAGTHTTAHGPTFTPAQIVAGTTTPPAATTTTTASRARPTTTTARRSGPTTTRRAAPTTTTVAAPTTATPAAPTTAVPTTAAPTTAVPTTAAPTTAAPTTVASPATTPSSTTPSTAPATTPEVTAPSTPSTTGLRIVSAGTHPGSSSSGPSPLGLAAGAVVVAGVAAASAVVVRRRRAGRTP